MALMFHTRRTSVVLLVALLVAAVCLPVASAADPEETAVQKAIAWLQTQQLAEGGFGGPSKQPVPAITSDVVYALALAGEDVDGPLWTKGGVSALDALAKMAPGYIGGDAGQAGKVARAAAEAGENPRSFGGMDVIAVIEQAYDPATGRYHPSFLFRQTLAMEGLRVAGEPVPAKAYEALRAGQLAGGGWAWAFPSQTQTPTADTDSTGRVLQTLAAESQGKCDIDFIAAVSYLTRTQHNDATWSDLPSKTDGNSNSTALAVGGLRSVGRDPAAPPFVRGGRSAVQALLAFQEPSGAFVYTAEPGKEELRITATTDALMGLLQPRGIAGACPSVYLPLFLAR
jgi:hypothetical protein